MKGHGFNPQIVLSFFFNVFQYCVVVMLKLVHLFLPLFIMNSFNYLFLLLYLCFFLNFPPFSFLFYLLIYLF